jgi:hypothetical protein
MLWKLNFITSWVSNSVTEFERKIENENDLQEREHSMIKNGTLP